MTLLVQKFGGTSLGSIERIKAVAQRIKSSKEKGNDLGSCCIGNGTYN